MTEKEESSKPKEEQENDQSQPVKKGNPVLLSRSYRFIAYLVMVSIEMAINVSSGVLSAASKTIKKQYTMLDVEFGYFGLAQGIGRTFGSIFYTVMVNQISAKWLGGAFSIVKGFVLASFFELTQSKWILIFLRGVIGFVHMPPSTYIPIWIDQYGLRKYKTVQMSFLQALVPVGKVLGFVLVNFFGEERWKMAYDVEGVYLVFCGLFIVLSPIDYLAGSKTQKLWNDLYTVITNYEFEICNCAKALQNGTQSCLHFWCGDFMINRLGMDGTAKTMIYTLMNISGPAIGFFLSPIINKFFGSYETPHAPIVIMVLHLITISFGLSATLINSVPVFIVCMTLFFGLLSLCLAMTNGCLMISVNRYLKGVCYSVGNITCMSITGALCPVIYGKVNDIFNPKGIRYAGMLSIMLINGSASLFLLELGRIKCKKEKMKGKKEELVDKDNEEGKELEDK